MTEEQLQDWLQKHTFSLEPDRVEAMTQQFHKAVHLMITHLDRLLATGQFADEMLCYAESYETGYTIKARLTVTEGLS